MALFTKTFTSLLDGETFTDYRDANGLLVKRLGEKRDEYFERYWHAQTSGGHWWYRRHRDLPLPAVVYKDERPPIYYQHGHRTDEKGRQLPKKEGWVEGWAQH